MCESLKKIIFHFLAKYKYRKSLIIQRGVCINTKESSFEGMNKIYSNTKFCGHMGIGSYIGPDSDIEGSIGRFSSIASDVKVIQGIHPYKLPFATTSPAFFSLRNQNGSTFAKEQFFHEFRWANDIEKISVIIGSDCWLGPSVLLISGVKIGDGVVVLAGAVVTHDVPPYAIVGGIPAAILGFRYDRKTIDFLLRVKWWSNDIEWFTNNCKLLCNMDLLKKYYEKSI
jgi:acetyltransferase-like isoleucine patch superfamily enzyme